MTPAPESTGYIFPFGKPVLPRAPSAPARRPVFILGAYPSALHVMWRPPEGQPVKAMAVDNEPVPFWNGDGELAGAAPDVVVTLGNAALRVLRTIAEVSDAPGKLAADTGYARELTLRVGGRAMVWFPLAHPAASQAYQDAHEQWRRDRSL